MAMVDHSILSVYYLFVIYSHRLWKAKSAKTPAIMDIHNQLWISLINYGYP